MALAQLLLAETAAAAGDGAATAAGIARGLAAFAALNVAEALNQRLAGRAWRRLGRLDAAALALRAGLPLARAFPLERADLHAELARVAAEGGDAAAARAEADRAAQGYVRCSAPRKIDALARAMSPHVTWRAADGALP